MSRRVRVPRASIGVTILDDVDAIALLQGDDADRAAFGVFVALLAAAKAQGNGGTFRAPLPVIAGLIRVPLDALEGAMSRIERACQANGTRPWITRTEGGLAIRSFAAWNREGWGGRRQGAGRKRKPREVVRNQDDSNLKASVNQDDSETDSSCCAPVSVSDTARTIVNGALARTGRNGVRAESSSQRDRACDAIQRSQRRTRALDLCREVGVSSKRLEGDVGRALIEIDRRALGEDALSFVSGRIAKAQQGVAPSKRGGYLATAIVEHAAELQGNADSREPAA